MMRAVLSQMRSTRNKRTSSSKAPRPSSWAPNRKLNSWAMQMCWRMGRNCSFDFKRPQRSRLSASQEAKMDQKLIRIAECTQLYCPIKMEHSHLMAHFSLSNRAPVSAFTKAPPSPDPPKKPVDLMASKKYKKWLDLLRGSTSRWCIQRSVCPEPAH